MLHSMYDMEVALRLNPGNRGLVIGLVQLGLVLALALLRQQPPAPQPASASPWLFSAARARAVEERLLAGLGPHPLGSSDNAQLRERLISELRSLGLSPQMQTQQVCGKRDHCSLPINVVAEIPGREGFAGSALTVLASAHYDSVADSPGASDDGAGVAALLEVARALKADTDSGHALRHPVLFLFDDGEEGGMLGARAFMGHHPLAASIGAAVNIEAHGTGGLSLMFETGPGNLWLMRLYREQIKRPASGSLFYLVYRLMPNDTDFSIFRRQGVPGFNFANIDHPEYYHTASDNLMHADLGTLQHHGDNALAAVRALADAELQAHAKEDAVWFDVLGTYLVMWPRRITPALGGLMVLLLLGTGVLMRRKNLLRWRNWLRGCLAVPLIIGGTMLIGLVIELGLVFLVKRFVMWPPYGPLLGVLFGMLGLAMVGAGAVLVARRASGDVLSCWLGLWSMTGALAFLLAIWQPEASYPWLIPTLLAGGTGLLAALRSSRATVTLTVLVPALVAALILLPMASALYSSLGCLALALIGLVLAQAGLPLLPLFIGTTDKEPCPLDAACPDAAPPEGCRGA